MTSDPDQLLEIYDQLDQDDRVNRRTSVFALEDFYGLTLTELGRSLLSLDNSIKQDSLPRQWSRVCRRLEILDGYRTPDKYEDVIPMLHDIRNKTYHNQDYDPPRSNLEDLREQAPPWKEWLIEQGNLYREFRVELDPRETIIEMARSSLHAILTEQVEFQGETSSIQSSAQNLLQQLNEIAEESNEITSDLIDVLEQANDLRRELFSPIEESIAISRETSEEVIQILEEEGEATPPELADRLPYSMGYLHRVLNEMASEGKLKQTRGSQIIGHVIDGDVYILTEDKGQLLSVIRRTSPGLEEEVRDFDAKDIRERIVDELAETPVRLTSRRKYSLPDD